MILRDNIINKSGPVELPGQITEVNIMKELKARVIHMLNVAINAKCTDRDEKIFFGAIIKDISELDPNSVNIPLTALEYLRYAKESPAVAVLKRDLEDLLD